nr:hypothetical protein CFP56_72732 [Quercus suber]
MENELGSKTWRGDQPRKMCGISVLKCFDPRGWEHPQVRELRYNLERCRSLEKSGTEQGGMRLAGRQCSAMVVWVASSSKFDVLGSTGLETWCAWVRAARRSKGVMMCGRFGDGRMMLGDVDPTLVSVGNDNRWSRADLVQSWANGGQEQLITGLDLGRPS